MNPVKCASVAPRRVAIGVVAALLCLAHRAPQADEPSFKALEKTYAGEIRPLIARYCHNCHSAKQAEADIDLASFATLADVRSQPKTWQKVREMLESGQMPPKKARQPGEAERTRLKQWVRDYLTVEARAMAGDPGRVVLRRLSNAEYTYTIRDLTGVASLEPAREFPVDGAAGEGFTNTGNALVMSPALITKYLDAAKEIAAHAVLFPDGIRFSPHATRRDWTDDTLAQIREFYGRFTDATGGTQVNLQGIISETNQGGRLPLQKYLLATLAERDSLANGGAAVEKIAQARGLNARYLGTLWQTLTDAKPSSLLDGLRARWRAATPDDAASLAAFVSSWQNELWKFATVGHIGKVGGPKAWMEPVNPLVARRDLRVKIPAEPESGEIVFSLVASDAGDGSENDIVVWEKPRLVAPGRPDLLLRDVRRVAGDLAVRRERVFANAAKYLNAADEVSALDTSGKIDLADLAQKHGVEVDALRAWLGYLGIGEKGPVTIEGHFADKLSKVSGYDFVNGWGTNETPLLVANSSDQHVRIPGNMKPHGVAVHPSPTLRAVVGWRSPISGVVSVSARIAHAHPECGNGVTWSLELRRGGTRQRLANGIAHGNAEVKSGPIEKLAVQPGDLVSLLIGPRDGHHACDLTAVDLALAGAGEGGPKWNLADDVSNDVHAGNPHADRLGHANVWHFYTERDNGGELGPVIPTGSLLAKWQTTGVAAEKQKLAAQVQSLLTFGPPADKNSPDAALYRQLASLGGPLFGARAANRADEKSAPAAGDWGPDPALFGKHPLKGPVDPANLYVRAPSVVEIRLPADLVAGCELVTTGLLDGRSGTEGSAQLQLVPGTLPSSPVFQPGTPIVANEGGAARKRLESAFDEFRRLFPIALCYTRIVPVDEAVTLTLFYREDDHLARLMLDERQKSQLDRLWDQLHYVSQDALTLVDAFAQLMEYATQDADPKVFEPLREPINARAAAFRQAVLDSEPAHLNSILDFATRAYRRPLAPAEISEVRELYARLRAQDISHDEAIRLTLARVLVAPAFLYRIEKPGPGSNAGPVSDWELASRLSYFLWSSQPDDDLLRVASTGRLRDQGVLLAQTRRMLRDPRVRRLATEFACQWLHIHDFDQLDEKSERHFPTFAGLRGDMYEESIQFFTDMFQNAGSVVDILDADHTFVNDNLAAHYGLPSGPAAAPGAPAVQDSQSSAWRRVEGVKPYGRGGILAQAATLAKQSGASRTSPILRGNWISEVLLGERLPRPPKEVPRLPEDETATEGLTVRQLVEKHTSDPKCSICHQRIDAFGFALEGFDAIGRRRDKDLGDRPIDTRAKAPDGAQLDGLEGLRKYLVTARREAFVRQFCRKLLGYALGRAVQLSDEPLLDEMENELKANSYKITAAIETIVRSRPFREIRGREAADDQ